MKTPAILENFIESMKTKILKTSTKALVNKNQTLRTSLPYLAVATIGILFTVEDKQKHEYIKELMKQLEADGKKVSVICFLPDGKENYEFKFNYFNKRDLTFWGNLTSADALEFVDTPFDLLYCLDLHPNTFIQNVLARSKAKCRIGKHFNDGEAYLEMMIENVSENKSLIAEIHRYSKQLR
jgi:hypothetical protein